MATLKFTSSTKFKSDSLIAVSQYPGLRVPAKIPAYAPIPISTGQMSRLAPDKLPAPAGLTVLESRSVTVTGQWKQVGTSPPQRQFQGGELKLSVELGVYIIQQYQAVPKLFELIMTHELMHVQDSYDIVDQFLPAELPKDDTVKRYLVDAKVVDEQGYQHWFSGDTFQQYVIEIWSEEWNKRGKARDSGPLYQQFMQKIAPLLPRL